MPSPLSLNSSPNSVMTIFPFTVYPQVEAMTTLQPFSTIAAPKAILDRAHIALDVEGTFPLFPFFPPEIRLKIWRANLRPQMLHIIYDIGLESHKRNTYLHGRQYRAAWRFKSSPATQMPNRFICQESRVEAEKAGYDLLRLRNNLTEARWYNHETDSLFFDTTAEARPSLTSWEDEYYYNHYVDNVLPPVGHPIAGGSGLLRNKLNVLAVSDTLWTDWPFSADNGSDVSCEMCRGFHSDNTHDAFKRIIERMTGLQKLVVVRTGDRSDDKKRVEFKLEKRQPEDPYGLSLLGRITEWKKEKGLDIKIEVLQLVG